jgi:hypothetical protein
MSPFRERLRDATDVTRQLNAPLAVAFEPTFRNEAVIAEAPTAEAADSATEDPRP